MQNALSALLVVLFSAFFYGPASAENLDWPKKNASVKELKDSSLFMEQVELRLKLTAAEQSVVVFGEVMIPLLQHFENLTPDLLEEVARDRKIELYFVAHPNIPPQFDAVGLVDGKKKKTYVWIGVNGEKERDDQLRELEMTEEQNRNRLKDAGWLKAKDKKNPDTRGA